MFARFELMKSVEAAGVILRAHPGRRISYLRLLKLLYIADREALRDTGLPIIGEHVVAMDNGPLHSEVLDLIKGEHPDASVWSRHIEKDGYLVTLILEPGVSELSRCEIQILNRVCDARRNSDDWEIVEETHAFREWAKHHRPKSSERIPLADILESLNFTPEDVACIRDEAEEAAKIERLSRSARS